MKRSFPFLLLLLFWMPVVGLSQSATKGLKALEKKDYATAKSEFEGVIQTDPNNVLANYGLARYYGSSSSGEKDLEESLNFLEKAEAAFKKADEKSKGKYEKAGVNELALKSRRENIERNLFEQVKKLNSIGAFSAFALRFPDSKYGEMARNSRNKLAFEVAKNANTVEELNRFLATYPDAYEKQTATDLRNKMAADEAIKAGTAAAMLDFLKQYPDAPQAAGLRQRANATGFEEAKKADTVEAFRFYVDNFPESIFLPQARQRLMELEAGVDK